MMSGSVFYFCCYIHFMVSISPHELELLMIMKRNFMFMSDLYWCCGMFQDDFCCSPPLLYCRPPRTKSSVSSAVPPPSWTFWVWLMRRQSLLPMISFLFSSSSSSKLTLLAYCPLYSTSRVSMATGSEERNSIGGFSFVQRRNSLKPWNTRLNDKNHGILQMIFLWRGVGYQNHGIHKRMMTDCLMKTIPILFTWVTVVDFDFINHVPFARGHFSPSCAFFKWKVLWECFSLLLVSIFVQQ